jgi:hypothetical protein
MVHPIAATAAYTFGLMGAALIASLAAIWTLHTGNRRKARGVDAARHMRVGFVLGLFSNLAFIYVLASRL